MAACPECVRHFEETLLLHKSLSSLPLTKANPNFADGVLEAIRNRRPRPGRRNPWNLFPAAAASLLLMILCNYIVGGPGGSSVEAAVQGSVQGAVVKFNAAGDTFRSLLDLLDL